MCAGLLPGQRHTHPFASRYHLAPVVLAHLCARRPFGERPYKGQAFGERPYNNDGQCSIRSVAQLAAWMRMSSSRSWRASASTSRRIAGTSTVTSVRSSARA